MTSDAVTLLESHGSHCKYNVDLEVNIALYRGPLWLHETMLPPHFRLKTVYKKGRALL